MIFRRASRCLFITSATMRSPLIRRPRLNSSQETFRCSSASCLIVLTVKAVRSCSSKTLADRSCKSPLGRASVSQARGSIVNICSTYGHEGAAVASVYVGSKHAVEAMTKSAALEAAGFGVGVNAVAPGPTDTDMLTRFTGAGEQGGSAGGCSDGSPRPLGGA
jgi:NAD(P)-dependent dehydrogenase (short-subunit alcohol dehydrogenase family)